MPNVYRYNLSILKNCYQNLYAESRVSVGSRVTIREISRTLRTTMDKSTGYESEFDSLKQILLDMASRAVFARPTESPG